MAERTCINQPVPGMTGFILANCCKCVAGACYCGKASGFSDCSCNTACIISDSLKSYRVAQAVKPFILHSGLKISGRLLDFSQRPHEEPLRDFEIRLVMPSGEVRRTSTDKNGSFELILEGFDHQTGRLFENFPLVELGQLFFHSEKGTSSEQNFYFLAIAPARA